MSEQEIPPPAKRSRVVLKEIDPSRYPEFEERLRRAHRAVEGEPVFIKVPDLRLLRLVIVLAAATVVSSITALLLVLKLILS